MKPKLQLNSRLVHYLLLGLIVLLVIFSAIGADEIVNLLHGQAKQLVSLKAQGQALTIEKSDLVSAQIEVKKFASLEKISESIVPQDKDQAETIREIVAIAQNSNISLTSISFPTSNLGTTTPAAPASGGTAATPVPLSQLSPVANIPGVYTLPIIVSVSNQSNAVSYANFFNFLSNLEQNRRTCLVTGLSIQPVSGGLVTFSLNINEYIKPR